MNGVGKLGGIQTWICTMVRRFKNTYNMNGRE
jgi:hypothetical protein